MTMLGYIRVSTDEQSTNGHGLAAQEARILERDNTAVIYRDEGASGKTLERPALRKVLGEIAAGHANGLIVAKLDRLTRSVIDFAVLLEWFTAANATLVALDFDLDTSTPTGRLIAHLIVSIAQWEREIIAARTSDALQAMKASGLAVGPPAVADRPEVVQRIRGMRDHCMTLREIAATLNEENVPSARGGRWSPSVVQTALGHKRKPARRRVTDLPRIKGTR